MMTCILNRAIFVPDLGNSGIHFLAQSLPIAFLVALCLDVQARVRDNTPTRQASET